nr:50S ribosome-binding GTPase [Candidatus Woesebacteria bacterium]
EKYAPKGGPDGGNGGDGGSVIIRATRKRATLQHLASKTSFEAQAGQIGGRKNQAGAKGEPIILDVPVGTQVILIAENTIGEKRRRRLGLGRLLKRDEVPRPVYELEQDGQPIPYREPDWCLPLGSQVAAESDEETQQPDQESQLASFFSKSARVLLRSDKVFRLRVADLLEDGEEIVICQGGFGGRGNDMFKNSTRQIPLLAEYGSFAERRGVLLELKLLADIGLVGFPNAGKSTLLSVVTKARPKVASYPFTTLEPNLGVLSSDWYTHGTKQTDETPRELVMADIPGLIEGASEGKGLGFDFLRHIEHCRVVQYVLALEESVLFDQELTDDEKAQRLVLQHEQLAAELRNYQPELAERPSLVTVNKLDLYSPELQQIIKSKFAEKAIDVILFSAATHDGIAEVANRLSDVFVEESFDTVPLVQDLAVDEEPA